MENGSLQQVIWACMWKKRGPNEGYVTLIFAFNTAYSVLHSALLMVLLEEQIVSNL